MQTDVKVFTPEVLEAIFPTFSIKKVGGKTAHYNSNVEQIDGNQLVELAKVHKDFRVDITLRRYGKGITIKVRPRPDEFIQEERLPKGN